jgi:hypothetical protein
MYDTYIQTIGKDTNLKLGIGAKTRVVDIQLTFTEREQRGDKKTVRGLYRTVQAVSDSLFRKKKTLHSSTFGNNKRHYH